MKGYVPLVGLNFYKVSEASSFSLSPSASGMYREEPQEGNSLDLYMKKLPTHNEHLHLASKCAKTKILVW